MKKVVKKEVVLHDYLSISFGKILTFRVKLDQQEADRERNETEHKLKN